MKNLGTRDRLFRVILAEICIIIAFFWVTIEWQIPLYLIGCLMLLQAATASCSFQTLPGWDRCDIIRRRDKNIKTAFVVAALLLAAAGSYASAVMTKNIFLDDLGKVNESYVLALQSAGQGQKENITMRYGNLESAFAAFQDKYSKYRPLTVKFDVNFTAQMNNISAAISGSKDDILKGNLTAGQKELMKAGPIIEKMQDR